MNFHVKTEGDPNRVLPGVRAALASIDEDVPLSSISTLGDHVRSTFARERLGAQVLAASALFALLLAAAGVYGVTAHSAAERTNEIGIRLALGAKASHIRSLFLRQGVAPVLSGVAVGAGASLILSRFVSGLLFGVVGTDFSTFAASAVTLVAVAALAGYLPARRASKVDPAVSLPHE